MNSEPRTQVDAVRDREETAACAGSSESFAVEQASDANRADWDTFVAAAPAAELYHDYRWRALIAEVFGHGSHYLLARESSHRVRGVLPLVRMTSRMFGDFLVSMPYLNYGGILADSDGATVALLSEAQKLAADLGVEHVELRHRGRPSLDLPVRDDKVTMNLTLPPDADALWASFKGKLRSQIRRPEKAGASVRQGGAELAADFYAVFARNMRDLGTPVYPRRFFDGVLAKFPEQARIFVVDLAGRPVAAGLVLIHRSTAEIPWASSLREANHESVNMMLYWSVLRDAIQRGLKRFDFGRSSRDSGTYRFKAQWGAEPEQLLWHYWLPAGRPLPRLTPNNPKYRAAIAIWRKLPMPVANFLGPRIVRNLP